MHEAPHTPSVQVGLAAEPTHGHWCPQLPQLFKSLESDAHQPLHMVFPAAQLTHWPELQDASVPHTTPQAPQFLGSFDKNVSQPGLVLSQSP